MRKPLLLLAVLFAAMLFSLSSWAQNIKISGQVTSTASNEGVGGVSVRVRNSSIGTTTDTSGQFQLAVPSLPVTLIFSSVGYDVQEIRVTSASATIAVQFVPSNLIGQEIVISASRLPQRILDAPVSIERINSATIRNAADPSYYDLVKNLKGVDLTISSLTFKTVGTRGFNGSGNLRFNQLVDGMDNQAPGLNFSVGSIIGPNELDVDNVELLQGASSALYGSGGTNGTMLITSKNPFKYQGLSFQVRQGVNHLGNSSRKVAPYYDWSVRYAKKISERFAFKLTGQYIKAQDWEANDTRNLLRNNVFSSLKAGDRTTDPNYDGVNIFGDEASASMASIAQAGIFGPSNPSLPQVSAALAAQYGRQPTQAEIVAYYAGQNPAGPFGPLVFLANGLARNYYGGQFVSRTGYSESDLVDYNAFNAKFSGSVHYKLTNDVEASLLGYWGTGTTVYTGADRYALKNLIMGQYKAEVRGRNWFLRANTTQENSGDSYTATTAALFVNNAWKQNATWFGTYSVAYAGNRQAGAPDAQAHAAARTAADQGRFLPGTPEFKTAFNNAINTSIKNGGAKFNDASDLYQFEGQYNLTEKIKVVDVLVGASHRIYSLNSNGTIFVDTTGRINVKETGGYVQLQKGLFNDGLRLTGSLRYDKHQNFKGRFTPRATALIKVAQNNNIRFSFQTAYRFPSNQDQYINLLTGGVNRLIGGLPEIATFYQLDTKPAFTAESIVKYRGSIAAGAPNPTLLQRAQFTIIKPERAKSFELGYRGLLTSKFLLDGYVYYTRYKDFIGRVAVGRGQSGDPARAPQELASPFTTNNMSFVVNTTNDVKAIGWGISGSYQFPGSFEASANLSSDKLNDVPPGVVTFFNTPKFRYNLGFSNSNLGKGFGFNLQWRWQDEVYWEGTFGTGEVPSFGTLDAQISYRLPKTKSLIKLGGSNILNKYYRNAFGNPQIGGLYYLSFAYNVL